MSTRAAKTWFSRLAPYRISDDNRAWGEVLITLIPYVSLWYGMWTLL